MPAQNPRHAAARAYLGLVALERGETGKAEVAFRDALSIDASCAEAHVGRVRLLRARGEWRAGYEEARLAVRVAPGSALARWELVNVLCHRAESPVGETQWIEAIPHLQRLVTLEKAPRQPHMELGDIYRQLGRWKEAIPHYREVLRIGQTRTPLAATSVAQMLHTCRRPGERLVAAFLEHWTFLHETRSQPRATSPTGLAKSTIC